MFLVLRLVPLDVLLSAFPPLPHSSCPSWSDYSGPAGPIPPQRSYPGPAVPTPSRIPYPTHNPSPRPTIPPAARRLYPGLSVSIPTLQSLTQHYVYYPNPTMIAPQVLMTAIQIYFLNNELFFMINDYTKRTQSVLLHALKSKTIIIQDRIVPFISAILKQLY